jgi:hypothetical protein
MTKVLVETIGSFQFDTTSGQLIRHEGCTVVDKNLFLMERIEHIVIHAELVPSATDSEWLAYQKEAEGDLALAVASFLTEFGTDKKPKKSK